MEIVPSGVEIPFEYTAYDQSSGLSVAMKIYNVTSGSAVFVATVPMTHIINGTYFANYTFLDQNSYVVNKMVYTDPGLWVLPSANYSPGSESLEASATASAITQLLELIYQFFLSSSIRASVKDPSNISVNVQ